MMLKEVESRRHNTPLQRGGRTSRAHGKGIRCIQMRAAKRGTCIMTGQRFKGYAPNEVIGQHFRVFYPRELQNAKWPEHELEVARETGRFEDEGWRLRKDGSRFWANAIIMSLHDDHGRHIGFAKVTRDLSDKRRRSRPHHPCRRQPVGQRREIHACPRQDRSDPASQPCRSKCRSTG